MTISTLDPDTGEVTPVRTRCTTSGRNPASESWKLVRRAQQGDQAAFGEIYDLYQRQVYRYAYRLTGNKDDAQDLTAATFTRALQRISTYDYQGRDFGAVLSKIVHGLACDEWKSARRQTSVRLRDSDGNRFEDPDRHVHPTEVAEANEAADVVTRALADLTPKQRRCVELRYLRGESLAETARLMGSTVSAIKALACRAMRVMREFLTSIGWTR